MRSKRKELADAVLIAARAMVAAADYDTSVKTFGEMQTAVQAYNAYDVAVITGAGAPWAEGSETSRQAAYMATPRQGSVRREIVALLSHVPPSAAPGYTDRQLERRTGGSHQTVSSARNWLCQSGWLEDSGVRRLTNDRPAAVWQLTVAARRELTKGTP